MEFLQLIEIKNRMCQSHCECSNCLLTDIVHDREEPCASVILHSPEEAQKLLIRWAEENPVKTFLMDFKEKYPKAYLTPEGLPAKICPCDLGYTDCFHTSLYGGSPTKCRYVNVAGKCAICWNQSLESEG